jgi:hypothetical protein
MTNQTKTFGAMKMLTKVARGMDLPVGRPSRTNLGFAPLESGGYFEEALISPESDAPQTENAGRAEETAAEGERRDSKKSQASDLPLDTAGLSGDPQTRVLKEWTLPDEQSTDKLNESDDSNEDDSEIPDPLENPDGDGVAGTKSDTQSDIPTGVRSDIRFDIRVAKIGQPSLQPFSPGHQKKEPIGPAPQMQGHDSPQPDQSGHDAVGEPRLSEPRWNYLSAEDFKDRTRRGVSRMLEPVFHAPAGDDPGKRDGDAENGKKITFDTRRTPDGRNAPEERYQLSDRPVSPVQIPRKIPGTTGGDQLPATSEKVHDRLNDDLSEDRKPPASTNVPPVPKTVAPMAEKDELQPPRQHVPGVHRVDAPAGPVNGIHNQRVSPGVSNADSQKKAGEVTIGKINIHVRGGRQTEEEWPAAPQYSDHKITADWEWSCHYGK